MQSISTKLPDGRELHVSFDDVARTLMELGHAGQALGSSHSRKPGESKAELTDRHNAARQRATKALHAAEDAIQAMLGTAAAEVWDRALDSRFPFKCGHCGERFALADELIDHATVDPSRDATCRKALEQGLRLASTMATRNGR